LEVLSEPEQAELTACEAVIEMGWRTFVDVGLALARIRDAKLYRTEYGSFEAYCQEKWQFKRVYAHYLISAAQVFQHLFTNCEQRKPERESQVRPLIGLTQAQAQAAWEKAVEKAAGRKITARLVKAAAKEVQPPAAEATGAEEAAAKPTQAQLREQSRQAMTELVILISRKTPYEVLLQKSEALLQLLAPLLGKRPPKAD
jgi:hypothetical protein